MKSIINAIRNGFKAKTVASVMAPVTRAIEELQEVSAQQYEAAAAQYLEAERLSRLAGAANEEGDAASRLAAKLEDLLNA